MKRTVAIPAALDMRATIRGAKMPVMVGPNGAWWSTRTPTGLGTLFLRRSDATEAEGEAWGPGGPWLLEQMPGLLGLRDNPSEFRPDGVIGQLWRRTPFRLSRTDRPWDALIGAILGQKVQVTRAVAARRAIARRFGDPAPGPSPDGRSRAWVLPSPETIGALGYHDLHACGVERKRAEVLIRTAREMRRLDALWDQPPAEVRHRLQQIRGIGPWTTAMISAVVYGDADAVPVGDYHMPNTVAWCLAKEPRADDARMLELLEPYRGHRWRVIRLAKSSGSAPKYGPRLSLTSDGMSSGR
ncbi:MAG: DNA-3-methyladenine glycosylase 2 family protein [Acidimicrobiales bacterium]|nr:DNA-3-methyladenine glycosylase 2 family protein [Acidimicrobiales bacterium]